VSTAPREFTYLLCVKCPGIDVEFESLLASIFGREFVDAYKLRRPSGWTDLMVAFESRKRSANPNKNHPLNVCLPFSFIEQYKKLRVSETQWRSESSAAPVMPGGPGAQNGKGGPK